MELNTAWNGNGRSPWRIVAQCHDPQAGVVYVFYSDHLWFDPSAQLVERQVWVTIDPADPPRYAMDVSFLPQALR